MLDDNELDAIDDWRFQHKLPSRAAAIRELLRRGLEQDNRYEEPPPHTASRDFRITEE